jgi:hypothetical protein
LSNQKENGGAKRRHSLFAAILIMKPILVCPAPSALDTPKSVFESPPLADFQKTIFIMRIAALFAAIPNSKSSK